MSLAGLWMEGLEGDSHSVFGKEGLGEDLLGFLK